MLAEICIPYILRRSWTLKEVKSRTHGLDHWYRVWETGQELAETVHGVDLEVVAMFALFHDAFRYSDTEPDPDHGQRGWLLWTEIERALMLGHRKSHIWTDRQSALLYEACAKHSLGARSTDPTVGVCWDADRLDLHRLGIWPHPQFMSTEAALDIVTRRWGKQ